MIGPACPWRIALVIENVQAGLARNDNVWPAIAIHVRHLEPHAQSNYVVRWRCVLAAGPEIGCHMAVSHNVTLEPAFVELVVEHEGRFKCANVGAVMGK